MKRNDPIREKKAWIRLIAAVVAAVVLLAVSGFGIFKMLGQPGNLMESQLAALESAGSASPEPAGSSAES